MRIFYALKETKLPTPIAVFYSWFRSSKKRIVQKISRIRIHGRHATSHIICSSNLADRQPGNKIIYITSLIPPADVIKGDVIISDLQHYPFQEPGTQFQLPVTRARS